MKHTKSKKSRGLVAKSIVYKSNKHPHDRSRELNRTYLILVAMVGC